MRRNDFPQGRSKQVKGSVYSRSGCRMPSAGCSVCWFEGKQTLVCVWASLEGGPSGHQCQVQADVQATALQAVKSQQHIRVDGLLAFACFNECRVKELPGFSSFFSSNSEVELMHPNENGRIAGPETHQVFFPLSPGWTQTSVQLRISTSWSSWMFASASFLQT